MKLINNIQIGAMAITTVLLLATIMPCYALAQSNDNVDNSLNNVVSNNYTGVVPASMIGTLKLNKSYYDPVNNTYVDPVITKARALKQKGMNDSQIVKEFAKEGITYFPDKNEWVKGTPMPRVNDSLTATSQNNTAVTNMLATASDTTTERNSWHRTTQGLFSGFQVTMEPGSMSLGGSGSTYCQYFTTHIGECWSIPNHNWVEVGIEKMSSLDGGQNAHAYAYDSITDHPNGYPVNYDLGIVNAGYPCTYAIQELNIHDSQGYVYWVELNGNIVRSGHIPSQDFNYGYIYQNKEVFKPASSPYYTNDASHSYAYDQSVYWYNNGGQTLNSKAWTTSSPSSESISDSIVRQSTYMQGSSAKFETWAQN